MKVHIERVYRKGASRETVLKWRIRRTDYIESIFRDMYWSMKEESSRT